MENTCSHPAPAERLNDVCRRFATFLRCKPIDVTNYRHLQHAGLLHSIDTSTVLAGGLISDIGFVTIDNRITHMPSNTTSLHCTNSPVSTHLRSAAKCVIVQPHNVQTSMHLPSGNCPHRARYLQLASHRWKSWCIFIRIQRNQSNPTD